MIETGKLEHLPYRRVTPVIWLALRPNADVEVVVATFENAGHRPLAIPIEANHVLSQILEGLIESFLVVFGLALAVADDPSAIADEEKDASVIDSIKSGHISHTI